MTLRDSGTKDAMLDLFGALTDKVPDVVLEGAGDTYHLVHARLHTLDFRLNWVPSRECFRAYVRASNGDETNAIASLYTPTDARRFCKAAKALFDLRAGRHVE